MDHYLAYLAHDRRHALARNTELAEHVEGAALFADISGFTPLTELMSRQYGARLGSEKLTELLDLVYYELIAEIERYGGSVISLSGDGLTCWFDGDDGRRALITAMALQAALARVGHVHLPDGSTLTLGMKVGISVGPARRMLVGDPQIRYLEALAGRTLERMQAAERLAQRGEVLLDERGVLGLETHLLIDEWRYDEETKTRFAVVRQLSLAVEPQPWPPLESGTLELAKMRPWLLPAIHERFVLGLGEMLPELRPVVALFMRFSGIDYDHDPQAAKQLDQYLIRVQQVLERYEATLIQLNIGDKGSYLFALFGAPIAHEDDAQRALSAALELRELLNEIEWLTDLQIGVSQGVVFSGSYGGKMRRSYSAFGDTINLSARLMTAAPIGQILVEEAVVQAVNGHFRWQNLAPIRVRGKGDPVEVRVLIDAGHSDANSLSDFAANLPMVGRIAVRQKLEQAVQKTLDGQGQILGLRAEAGLGKSRLIGELLNFANTTGLTGWMGACQSYGSNIAYLVWQPIWRAFFGLEPEATLEQHETRIAEVLTAVDPSLLPRLPLLGPVLGLNFADTDLTRGFDALLRKASREALLIECLKQRASQQPLLFVLEDIHWLDPLSHDLAEAIGRVGPSVPLLLICTFRPPELARLQTDRIFSLPHAEQLILNELSEEETIELIKARVLRRSGTRTLIDPGHPLVRLVIERTQGNPFYVEEFLNYLYDQGFDPRDPRALERVELPSSLHRLLLSRVDRLSAHQQMTLKVASVIGRVFRVLWLQGYYPALGGPEHIVAGLEGLRDSDLISPIEDEVSVSYLFRHVITQEVIYESLAYATRSALHERLAIYLEQALDRNEARVLDLIVYHYTRSANREKQRFYLQLAGDRAAAAYALETAIDYYQRLMPLYDSALEQAEVLLKLVSVIEQTGRWEEALMNAQRAYDLLQQSNAPQLLTRCQMLIGRLIGHSGDFALAETYLVQALRDGTPDTQVEVLMEKGRIASDQANYAQAEEHLFAALELIQNQQLDRQVADTLSRLSWVCFLRGQFQEMHRRATEALHAAQRAADRVQQAMALRRLGLAALSLEEREAAQYFTEESLMIYRQIGDREGEAACLHNIGQIKRLDGKFTQALQACEEALELERELGGRRNVCMNLFTMGWIYTFMEQYPAARVSSEEGLAISASIGNRWIMAGCYTVFGIAALAEGHAEQAREQFQSAFREAQAIRSNAAQLWVASGLVRLLTKRGDLLQALELIGLVLEHPERGADAPALVRPYLEQIRPHVPPSELEAALYRGRNLDLTATLRQELGMFEEG